MFLFGTEISFYIVLCFLACIASKMNSAYQCNICAKMLSTENALNDHKASQQGEGDNFSYNCPECPYTVISVHKANLKRHLKTAHKYPEKRIKLDQWRQKSSSPRRRRRWSRAWTPGHSEGGQKVNCDIHIATRFFWPLSYPIHNPTFTFISWNRRYLYLDVHPHFVYFFAHVTHSRENGYRIPPPIFDRRPGKAGWHA